MKLDQGRVKRWLLHFCPITEESQWNHIHVSGNGFGDQIKRVIDGSEAKTLVPIYTEHEYHKKWHPNVNEAQSNDSIF